jgi:hypothetical protein
MKPPLQPLCARALILLAPALLALGVALARPREEPAHSGELARADDPRGRELEQQRREALWRQLARKEVAEAVIAGRLDLVEAASRFRELNRRVPVLIGDGIRLFYPAATEEESLCLQVIDRVHHELGEDDPCLAAAVASELQSQLERHLRGGPLRLPEASPVAAVVTPSEQ